MLLEGNSDVVPFVYDRNIRLKELVLGLNS